MEIERRRSQRIFMCIPGRIYGSRSDKTVVHEDVSTHTLSAHGALLNVAERYDMGMNVLLTNLVTEEEVPSHVVFVGESKEGQKQVAIEFNVDSPNFWRIYFPPPTEKSPKR